MELKNKIPFDLNDRHHCLWPGSRVTYNNKPWIVIGYNPEADLIYLGRVELGCVQYQSMPAHQLGFYWD